MAVLDPVTLILGALAAGAIKGAGETATTTLKDAYAELKKLVARRLAGRPTAEMALAEHEQDPELWSAPLGKELTQAGATTDPEVVKAAEQLMALVDPAGFSAGKYAVDLRGAQGVQVGDHNKQINTFRTPPPIPSGMSPSAASDNPAPGDPPDSLALPAHVQAVDIRGGHGVLAGANGTQYNYNNYQQSPATVSWPVVVGRPPRLAAFSAP